MPLSPLRRGRHSGRPIARRPRRARAKIASVPPPAGPSGDAALLDCAGPVEGAHVLVIGEALEVMCALIRRGCAAAAEVLLSRRPTAGCGDIATTDIAPAGIAVVPRLQSPELAAAAVALARRVLEPCGRIVLRDSSETLARHAASLLRNGGFSAIRVRVLPDATLVTAERPFFGPSGFGKLAVLA